MSTATDVLAEVDVPVHRGPSRLRRLGRMARQRPLGAFGAVVILILLVTAVFGQDISVGGETIIPGFAPYKAEETNIVDKLKGPSWSHIAGTDELGRDIFTRIIYGARTAMIIGLAATGIGIAIGTLIGTVSAYVGGFWDLSVQRVSDAMQALPPLVLMMVLVTMMSPGIGTVVFVIVIFLVPGTQRVIRGTVLSLKEFTYIEAARTIGASSPRIVLRHIMPNIVAPIMVLATVTIGGTNPRRGCAVVPRARRELRREPNLGIHPVRGDQSRADYSLAVARPDSGHCHHADCAGLQSLWRRDSRHPRSETARNRRRRLNISSSREPFRSGRRLIYRRVSEVRR